MASPRVSDTDWLSVAAEKEAHIEKLQLELNSAKRDRNSDTPLYKCSKDVLLHILLFVYSDEVRDFLAPHDYRRGLTWIRAMSSCQRFRDILLHSTTIWSSINLKYDHLNWPEICLERAGGHPLSVSADIIAGDKYLPVIMRILEANISRITHLQLAVTHMRNGWSVTYSPRPKAIQQADQALKSLMNIARPGLRNLRITNQLSSYSCPVDPQFLGGAGAEIRLSHLTLNKCSIESMPLMPSLEHLRIQQSYFGSDLALLRHILLQTPSISFLCLENSYTDMDEPPQVIAATVELFCDSPPLTVPKLISLELSGSLSHVTRPLLLLPKPSRDLIIHVSDAYDTRYQPGTDIEDVRHIQRLLVQDRIEGFLRQSREGSRLAPHGVGLQSQRLHGEDVVSQLHMYPLMHPDEFARNQQTVSIKFACRDYATIASYAEDIGIDEGHDLAHFSEFLTNYDGIKGLSIIDLSLPLSVPAQILKTTAAISDGSADPVIQASWTVLEQILPAKAGKGKHLPILYMGYSPPHYKDPRSDDPNVEQCQLWEQRWIDAGWITKVVW